jgi:protein-tyrosine phosphatase
MAALVDIHSHILPAVDDGADSLETALEMLRRGVAEGIGTAVLTPHLHPEDGPPQEELHRERFGELQEAVRQAGLPIEIRLGAEISFRFGLAEVAGWPSGTLVGGGRFALVDLPPGPLSPGLEQGFFELRTSGFRPILAHPERQRHLAKQPERIARLRQQEVLMQIDAGSLTGQFGTRAQQTAEGMVRRGWAEFVASDAHDLEKRPFSLVAARGRVEKLSGSGEVRRLMVDNPGRVVRGEEVEQRAGSAVDRPRRGLLRRLLGFKKSS